MVAGRCCHGRLGGPWEGECCPVLTGGRLVLCSVPSPGALAHMTCLVAGVSSLSGFVACLCPGPVHPLFGLRGQCSLG